MYFGAHTGRFSGSGGNLNLQNLPREEMFGANLRHLIAPKEGKKLIVVDLSQIEVRTLCWLAEDKNMLAEIAKLERIILQVLMTYMKLLLFDLRCGAEKKGYLKRKILNLGIQLKL